MGRQVGGRRAGIRELEGPRERGRRRVRNLLPNHLRDHVLHLVEQGRVGEVHTTKGTALEVRSCVELHPVVGDRVPADPGQGLGRGAALWGAEGQLGSGAQGLAALDQLSCLDSRTLAQEELWVRLQQRHVAGVHYISEGHPPLPPGLCVHPGVPGHGYISDGRQVLQSSLQISRRRVEGDLPGPVAAEAQGEGATHFVASNDLLHHDSRPGAQEARRRREEWHVASGALEGHQPGVTTAAGTCGGPGHGHCAAQAKKPAELCGHVLRGYVKGQRRRGVEDEAAPEHVAVDNCRNLAAGTPRGEAAADVEVADRLEDVAVIAAVGQCPRQPVLVVQDRHSSVHGRLNDG
mmetsp:Transcript_31225/g.90747  ORF Transcript_31225/g.90747 Transcript_31225/m.90747 type:complete len:349 (+) Transcript_31225:4358-5404(+)